MSIFDTNPPSIDKDSLYKWLYNNYSFLENTTITHSKKLNSERDYNLLIILEDKKKFIVKISNASENYEILSLQDSILTYLSKTKIDKYIPTIVHNEIKQFKDSLNRQCFVRILSFIEGNMFADNQQNNILCKNFSIFLGDLTNALNKFEHPAAHRKFIWNSIDINWINNELELFNNDLQKNTIQIVLDSYKNIVIPSLKKIRYSIIHGDANNYNVLTSNDNIVGLLDFGDCIYAPTVCELTVGLAYSLMNFEDISSRLNYMVKNYNSIFTLNKDEIHCIWTLVASRLAITVTMAAKQKKKYPDNNYLSISENDAWNLLYKIKDMKLDNLTKTLLKDI
tara:strand:+ start:455 stop:1468 length:1014 start_codon:yes stop_codon:yes gene_type:complete